MNLLEKYQEEFYRSFVWVSSTFLKYNPRLTSYETRFLVLDNRIIAIVDFIALLMITTHAFLLIRKSLMRRSLSMLVSQWKCHRSMGFNYFH